MNYIQIPNNEISKVLTNTFDHYSGHVIICCEYQEELHIILGHNKEYNNVATFGGLSDNNENLLSTIIREYSEESLDCVLSKDEIINKLLLTPIALIKRTSSKGTHYHIFITVCGNFNKMREQFKQKLINENLTKDQLENDNLVLVPFANIVKINNDTNIKDFENNNVILRLVILDAFIWFENYLNNFSDNFLEYV